jgi:cob(I)alamin adenosyltransferase
MILVYTGDGEGKTSAGLGKALRALGRGLKVTFISFCKGQLSGEQITFCKLKEIYPKTFDFLIAGSPKFIINKTTYFDHKQAVDAINFANTSKINDLIVLDEVTHALNLNLVNQVMIEEIIKKYKHVIITGRSCPQFLLDRSELITTLREDRHYYSNGIQAIKGLDF